MLQCDKRKGKGKDRDRKTEEGKVYGGLHALKTAKIIMFKDNILNIIIFY